MIARVKVYGADGVTARTANVGQGAGILPTVGLQFSVEVGGAGACSFTALNADLDSLNARDSVIRVQLETAPSTWTDVAAYTLRPPFRRPKTGRSRVECTAVALLEQWATETMVMPEYITGTMPPGAGTERSVSWVMSAYDPTTDPNEAWNDITLSSRTTYPSESIETGAAWPSTSGAGWITVTGATNTNERKLFRTATASPLEITSRQTIRCYVASDTPGVFYVAGEPVITVDGGQPGKAPTRYHETTMWVEAGEYACAFDVRSYWPTTSGDNVDPVLVAIASIDDGGDPDGWLLVSDTTGWVACRRDDEPPGDGAADPPPGPNPGVMLGALVDEAQERTATGWENVTLGFSATTDSYGDAWPTTAIERVLRYGADNYWSLMRMTGEVGEVDVWLTPNLVLEAAPAQGEALTGTVELTEDDIEAMSDTYSPDPGSYVIGLALDGWVKRRINGVPRREFALELGTAQSMPIGVRIADAALAEMDRWDGSARLVSTPSITPLVDFGPGDTIDLTCTGAPVEARVLSVSATAGGGGLRWDVELTDEGV